MRILLDFAKRYKALFISLSVFSLLLFSTLKYTAYKRGLWEKDIRGQLMEQLVSSKSKLEKALYSRIYYTKGVAAYVSFNPEITDLEFQQLANELVKTDSVISTMALSKNCIIGSIYPLKGHEAAIGLDLLAHPERKEIVEKTISTHKTFIAGPVELIEGGIAFISYTPIFDKTAEPEKFWGITDIVIYRDQLFAEAGLNENNDEFLYAIKGYNGQGDAGDIFWGNLTVFNANPVKIQIDLPDGAWILAAVPVNGWEIFINQDRALTYALIFSSLIISILVGLVAMAIFKIQKNEKEQNAIFASMESLIVEIDKDGRYLKLPPTNSKLLYKPANELLGKTFHEVFDKQIADYFLDAVLRCIECRCLVIIEYKLDVRGDIRWFKARISYKSDQSVIFNTYDNSNEKAAIEKLKDSEEKLIELNAMKDKFFSILAHDLRAPIGNFKVITELFHDSYRTLSDAEKLKLTKSMQNSAVNINALFENLIEWSMSHQGKLIFKPQVYEIKPLFDEFISTQLPSASLKQLSISNNVQEGVTAKFDKNMTSTILRNLISNAIKFTRENGKIQISNQMVNDNDKEFVIISVKDSGIGINEDTIVRLFKMDDTVTSPGTNNEKGSGLGLVLCKEFVEKQGGKIWVESQEGEGTTFSFSLPV